MTLVAKVEQLPRDAEVDVGRPVASLRASCSDLGDLEWFDSQDDLGAIKVTLLRLPDLDATFALSCHPAAEYRQTTVHGVSPEGLDELFQALGIAAESVYDRIDANGGPDQSREDLQNAVDAIRTQLDAVSRQVGDILAVSRDPIAAATNVSRRVMDTLTRRQSEVLKLAAQGLRTADIAKQIAVSERTVQAHIRNARGRMAELEDRAAPRSGRVAKKAATARTGRRHAREKVAARGVSTRVAKPRATKKSSGKHGTPTDSSTEAADLA